MSNWAGDSQLIRGKVVDGYNLSIGEPQLLREAMEFYYPRHYPADLSYPDTRPDPDLLRELRELHPEGEIVVTVGAKQALYAAVYALKQTQEYKALWHREPYWPTYPTIASYMGLSFNSGPPEAPGTIRVVTSPNNPDSHIELGPYNTRTGFGVDIWDAAYASELYGWCPDWTPNHRIGVWSAGKLLGNPGVRVGWLVTREPALAAAATRYVEQTTSGVPTTSQYHVAATLRNIKNVRQDLIRTFKVRLSMNTAFFYGYLDDHVLSMESDYCNGGMFAWFKPTNPERFAAALKAAKVTMVEGSAFGSPGFYRANLGLNQRELQDAVLALSKEL